MHEETNSTHEKEDSDAAPIENKTEVLELSPPLTRYRPNHFEKTFAHKLDKQDIWELEHLKTANMAKIQEIEEQYFTDSKTTKTLLETITDAQDQEAYKKKKGNKADLNYPHLSRGEDPPPNMGTYMYNPHLNDHAPEDSDED